MASSKVSGVRLVGLASAVPNQVVTSEQAARVFTDIDISKVASSIGVQQRYIVKNNECTSDLCFAAANVLLEELQWERESIDALIFVSQTPDYILPATSCALHGRLALQKKCIAFDINLGCSGYVYGLWVISQLVASGAVKRALLLVGDTISRVVSPQDRSTALLFGDAGTATALEADPNAPEMYYELGTDGKGQDVLKIPAGMFRYPRSEHSSIRQEREKGNARSDEELYMDGAEIFTFSLREVPPLIRTILAKANWNKDSVDAYVFHQANKFMIEYLAKRLRLPKEKVLLTMAEYGNTSSASIPLALTHSLASELAVRPLTLLIAGFGVGLSWAAGAITVGPMVMPPLIIVPGQTLE